jgi:hypothetical protein
LPSSYADLHQVAADKEHNTDGAETAKEALAERQNARQPRIMLVPLGAELSIISIAHYRAVTRFGAS